MVYKRHRTRCRAYQVQVEKRDANPATLTTDARQVVWSAQWRGCSLATAAHIMRTADRWIGGWCRFGLLWRTFARLLDFTLLSHEHRCLVGIKRNRLLSSRRASAMLLFTIPLKILAPEGDLALQRILHHQLDNP